MKVLFQLWRNCCFIILPTNTIGKQFQYTETQWRGHFVLVFIVVNHYKAVDKGVLKHPQIFGITM